MHRQLERANGEAKPHKEVHNIQVIRRNLSSSSPKPHLAAQLEHIPVHERANAGSTIPCPYTRQTEVDLFSWSATNQIEAHDFSVRVHFPSPFIDEEEIAVAESPLDPLLLPSIRGLLRQVRIQVEAVRPECFSRDGGDYWQVSRCGSPQCRARWSVRVGVREAPQGHGEVKCHLYWVKAEVAQGLAQSDVGRLDAGKHESDVIAHLHAQRIQPLRQLAAHRIRGPFAPYLIERHAIQLSIPGNHRVRQRATEGWKWSEF